MDFLWCILLVGCSDMSGWPEENICRCLKRGVVTWVLKLIFWRCRATVRGIPLAFAYLQKATLGSTPCRRFWPSVGPLPTEFFQRRQEAPGAFLVPSEREVRQCPQKETLGSTLASNAPLATCLFLRALRGPAACPLATCRALSWRFSSGFRKRR